MPSIFVAEDDQLLRLSVLLTKVMTFKLVFCSSRIPTWFHSILKKNAMLTHALTARVRVSANLELSGPPKFDPVSCESRPAIATATRDQHHRHNALLQPKHNWRSAVSDHTALRDAAAWIPHPSILQRLANCQLFLLDHSRRTQGWQPGSWHLRHPSHWIEQEDQALRGLEEPPEAGSRSPAPLNCPGGRGPRTLGILPHVPHTSAEPRTIARAR